MHDMYNKLVREYVGFVCYSPSAHQFNFSFPLTLIFSISNKVFKNKELRGEMIENNLCEMLQN